MSSDQIKLAKDGVSHVTRCRCPECKAKLKAWRKEYSKQHWEKNKDKLKAQRADKTPEEKAAHDAYMKKYREDHKEEHAEWGKKHRAENAEAISAQRAQYRQNNKDIINERQKEYYENNRDERLAYAKTFRDEKMAPHYKMWDSIIQRTTNSNHKSYHRYGERGITICEPWRNSYSEFERYINDYLGPKPTPDHSIDRIDNNAGYEPGNLKWSTRIEQQNNRNVSSKYRTNISGEEIVSFDNRSITLQELSDLTGIHLVAVKYRFSLLPYVDFILNENKERRDYKWKDHNYNLTELSFISGIKYDMLLSRIKRLGWSVEDAMDMD